MSVHVTSEPLEAVALFDSTTGIAFGPVFKTSDDAEAFLEWLARIVFEQPVCDLYELKGVIRGAGDDPRDWMPDDLAKLVMGWQAERDSWEPSDREMFGAGSR